MDIVPATATSTTPPTTPTSPHTLPFSSQSPLSLSKDEMTRQKKRIACKKYWENNKERCRSLQRKYYHEKKNDPEYKAMQREKQKRYMERKRSGETTEVRRGRPPKQENDILSS
jgi:hypothetical protein